MTDPVESGVQQSAPPAKSYWADLATKIVAGIAVPIVLLSATAVIAHESRIGAVESKRASEAESRRELRASEAKAHDKQHAASEKKLDAIQADLKKLLEAR